MIVLTFVDIDLIIFFFDVRYSLRILHMNLVHLNVRCILTMENHTPLLNCTRYFLYTFHHKHGNLIAYAGVGLGLGLEIGLVSIDKAL